MKKLFAGILFVALLTAAAGNRIRRRTRSGDIMETAHVITAAPVAIQVAVLRGRCHGDADNDGVCDYCGAEDGVCHWGRNLCGYG